MMIYSVKYLAVFVLASSDLLKKQQKSHIIRKSNNGDVYERRFINFAKSA